MTFNLRSELHQSFIRCRTMLQEAAAKSRIPVIAVMIISLLTFPDQWLTALPSKNFQQNIVTGSVTNSNGEPLVGVSITVQGTNVGTSSDDQGKYSIEASGNSTLVFSYVGYTTKDELVNGRKTINITMNNSASELDQVIVIGYGTQKRSDLTGSIARITMDDKATQANVNLFQALVGASAGVNLEERGGAAGEPTLSVRGQTSLSASDRPLIVLDGVIYNGSISNININDVETIDILKDASAAAV